MLNSKKIFTLNKIIVEFLKKIQPSPFGLFSQGSVASTPQEPALINHSNNPFIIRTIYPLRGKL